MIRVGSLFDNMLIKEDYRDAKTGMSAQSQLDGIFRQAKILSGRRIPPIRTHRAAQAL